MGVLEAMLGGTKTAGERIEVLEQRRADLLDERESAEEELKEARDKLTQVEREVAEARVVDAADELTAARDERTRLREEVDDLTSAIEIVEERIGELETELDRERLADLGDKYREEYSRADEFLKEFEPTLDRALELLASYLEAQRSAAGAAQEMRRRVQRLNAAGHKAEMPVETSNTDRRLLAERARFVQIAVELLPTSAVGQSWDAANV